MPGEIIYVENIRSIASKKKGTTKALCQKYLKEICQAADLVKTALIKIFILATDEMWM